MSSALTAAGLMFSLRAIMDHVRAGQQTVEAESEAAGFVRMGQRDFLDDNYFLRFRIPEE